MTWNNQTLPKHSSDKYLKSYVFYFFNFCLGKNFRIEAHYKNFEELVPKHPPDGIIVHRHFFCSSTVVSGTLWDANQGSSNGIHALRGLVKHLSSSSSLSHILKEWVICPYMPRRIYKVKGTISLQAEVIS